MIRYWLLLGILTLASIGCGGQTTTMPTSVTAEDEQRVAEDQKKVDDLEKANQAQGS